MNPTGKHRPKRRRHGDGTVIERKPYRLKDGTLRKRRLPFAAVVPYLDESGQRKEMWLSASSRREAEALRDAEIARQRKGIVRTEQTVGEYVSAWLDNVEVGPGTLPRYQSHIRERIVPSLGSVPLDALKPQQVRSAVIRWKGAPQTRGGALRLLRAAMKQAVADRHIEHDPTAGIPYPKVTRREPVTLTGDEARHLMAVVKGERFAPILVVSLGLGVRRGEALGLRVQDIKWEGDESGDSDLGERTRAGGREGAQLGLDATRRDAHHQRQRAHAAGPDGRDVRVDRERGRPVSVTIAHGLRYIPPPLRAEGEGPYRLTGTKTGETRTVPLPAFVSDALRERLAEREREQRAAKVYAPNGFVFCDPVGNSVPLETLRTWYHGALTRAGLPPCRWHDLRATTITLLVEMGVDLLTIQRIAGHKDLATTRLYVGKTPTAMAAAAERIDEAMG